MIDFDALKSSVDLVEVSGRYTPPKRVGGEWKGPCPICGGVDRFHVTKDRMLWGCRKCGVGGDVVGLVAKVEGISMVEAAKLLGAREKPARKRSAQMSAIARIAEQRERPIELTSETWQAEASKIMLAAEGRFAGSSGAEYLAGRGISAETARAWRIGFFPEHFDPRDKSKRPALVIPWVDGSGALDALKYRFVDPLAASDKGRRFTQKADSKPTIFGLHLVTGGGPSRSLIVVEGELNALAVWQATRADGFDVVSIGSDGAGSTLRSMAVLRGLWSERQYRRLLVWADEEAKADAVADGLGVRRCAVTWSAKGQDANDVLRDGGAGVLAERVRGAFGHVYPVVSIPVPAPVADSGPLAPPPGGPPADQVVEGPPTTERASVARTAPKPLARSWPRLCSRPGSDFDRLTMAEKYAACLAAKVPGADELQAELSLRCARPVGHFMRCWELHRMIVVMAERGA